MLSFGSGADKAVRIPEEAPHAACRQKTHLKTLAWQADTSSCGLAAPQSSTHVLPPSCGLHCVLLLLYPLARPAPRRATREVGILVRLRVSIRKFWRRENCESIQKHASALFSLLRTYRPSPSRWSNFPAAGSCGMIKPSVLVRGTRPPAAFCCEYRTHHNSHHAPRTSTHSSRQLCVVHVGELPRYSRGHSPPLSWFPDHHFP